MKILLSFILVTVMLFSLVMMPVYADNSETLQMTVNGGEQYVVISYNEITDASYYDVIIRDPETREEFVSERVEGLSYNWEPGYDVSPNEVFEIRVVACNSYGAPCARSNVVTVSVNVILWDYWGDYGDVDNDFTITVMDATVIQRYLAKHCELDDFELKKGDVDNDSEVSTIDANEIQRYCAGYEDRDTLLGESFMLGGIDYELIFIEPEEKPTVEPTVEEPTEEQPTEAPTDPQPPVATSSPIIILPVMPG